VPAGLSTALITGNEHLAVKPGLQMEIQKFGKKVDALDALGTKVDALGTKLDARWMLFVLRTHPPSNWLWR